MVKQEVPHLHPTLATITRHTSQMKEPLWELWDPDKKHKTSVESKTKEGNFEEAGS